ncbi:DUF7857 domain-containing protein [Halobellus ruber]|uniref:DUF8080 domain-containing protein n=1 Tax=Halobellus ruber TaxID=2761102 RepID=A0A7J9SMT6_9EURY|nr:hypothetical protein [Halobellus ruber]MBB6647459.1 hypothetical protein [Halobellus ruber]
MSPDPPDAPTDATASRPVRADVTTNGAVGVVFVAVTLRNGTAADVRVRVENDLNGPVLPPRQAGVPAAGWDEDGFTGVVPADATVGIGYACPTADGGSAPRADPDSDAQPASDPISLDVLGPADDVDPSATDRVADAVRTLGRATPPADVVPATAASDADGRAAEYPCRCGGGADVPDVPAPIAEWLDAAERRVQRAERLTDATADEAAAVLEGCGGVDGVATLPADLERDLASLRAVGDRIEALAARAADTDPDPVVSSLVGRAAADRFESEACRTNGTAGPRSEGTR